MKTLETKPQAISELSLMVERTIIYHGKLAVNTSDALAYWDFVERNYFDRAFERSEITVLMHEADEILDNLNTDLEQL